MNIFLWVLTITLIAIIGIVLAWVAIAAKINDRRSR